MSHSQDAGSPQAVVTQRLVSLEATADLRIGQPLVLRVESSTGEITSIAGLEVAAADSSPVAPPGLDDGWVVVEGPRPLDGGRAVEWTLLSLDAGDRTAPEVTVRLADGQELTAPSATVLVTGELAAGEDAPRPSAGFRQVEDTQRVEPGSLALGAIAILVVAVLAFLVARRRSRPQAAPSGPSAEERLQALARPEADAHESLAQLGGAARAVVDEAVGRDRRALSDEEWCAHVAEHDRLASDVLETLRRALEGSAELRFGGPRPSVLGAREHVSAVVLAASRLPSVGSPGTSDSEREEGAA